MGDLDSSFGLDLKKKRKKKTTRNTESLSQTSFAFPLPRMALGSS